MESRFLTLDGMRTHHVVAGQGPPLLLVPGLASSIAVAWQRVVLPLTSHFRVHALDLPGNGDSDRPDRRYTLQEGVDFLLRYLDHHGIAQTNLLGSSAGGLLSTLLALQHPDRVQRLVLVSSAGFGRDIAWFLRLLTLPFLGELLTVPHDLLLRLALRGVYARPGQIDAATLTEITRVRRIPGTSRAILRALRVHVGLRGLNPELVLLEQLHRLTQPTMLIWGDCDGVIPLAHARAAARLIPDCRLEIFTGCGHDPAWEQPERFRELLRGFILQPALRTAA